MSEATLEISPEDAFNPELVLPQVPDTVAELLGGNALRGNIEPFGVKLWQEVPALIEGARGKLGTSYGATTLSGGDYDYADPPPEG